MSIADRVRQWLLRSSRMTLPPALLLLAIPAEATQGHVFAKETVFNAATYVGHPKYGTHPSYYSNSPEQVADINLGQGSWDDEGTPLFAPEDGTVAVVRRNTDSWGYAIEWMNAAGTERLFMAHLRSITAVGLVRAGDQIGEIGGTGGWKPHLHLESADGWIVLSGRKLRPPVNPHGNGRLHVSNGPVPSDGTLPAQPAVVTLLAAGETVYDFGPTERLDHEQSAGTPTNGGSSAP